MGAIGGLLGLGGGAAGTDFAGPQGTNLIAPTDAGQLATAYGGNQQALQQQQALLNALQGGVQNQANTYNQVAAQGGMGNQSQVFNQLQGLAGQLQGVAAGTGPNPAQAQLAQATGQNVANQAALMAGQRGAGANAGMLARQAAQQGAATQQQAAGQAATLQAQQSLNALNQVGSTLGQAGGLANTQAANQIALANQQAQNQIGATTANTQAQQNEQQQLFGANQGFNNANVSMQSNINNANAGLANTQMQGQQGLIGGVMQGLGSLLARGGDVQHFDTGGDAPSQGSASFAPDPGAEALSKGASSMVNPMGGKGDSGGGGGGGGIMSMLPMLAMAAADGGEAAPAYSLGVNTDLGSGATAAPVAAPKAQSSFGKFLSAWSSGSEDKKSGGNAPAQGGAQFGGGAQAMQQGAAAMTSGLGKDIKGAFSSSGSSDGGGLTMPEMGSQFSAPAAAPSLGANLAFALGGGTADYRNGGKVNAKKPSQKASKKGDAYANDKIPAVLSEHEIVIPRSITMGKDPVRNSANFVAAVIAKRKARR